MANLDTNAMKANMAEFLNLQVGELDDTKELRSLVRDSFILVELVMRLQEDFSVRIMQEDLRDVSQVGELIQVFKDKSAH